MLHETIVAVVFKLINFVIIIAAAWFMFRKYFSRTLSEKIAHKELETARLQERTIALRQDHHVLDERIAHDKQYASKLTKKIDAWNNYIQTKRAYQDQQEALIQQAREQKQIVQKKQLQQQWFYKQVFPQALKIAEDQLRQEYASVSRQEQFIVPILDMMKQR
jgi:uncharacterized membrane protein